MDHICGHVDRSALRLAGRFSGDRWLPRTTRPETRLSLPYGRLRYGTPIGTAMVRRRGLAECRGTPRRDAICKAQRVPWAHDGARQTFSRRAPGRRGGEHRAELGDGGSARRDRSCAGDDRPGCRRAGSSRRGRTAGRRRGPRAARRRRTGSSTRWSRSSRCWCVVAGTCTWTPRGWTSATRRGGAGLVRVPGRHVAGAPARGPRRLPRRAPHRRRHGPRRVGRARPGDPRRVSGTCREAVHSGAARGRVARRAGVDIEVYSTALRTHLPARSVRRLGEWLPRGASRCDAGVGVEPT